MCNLCAIFTLQHGNKYNYGQSRHHRWWFLHSVPSYISHDTLWTTRISLLHRGGRRFGERKTLESCSTHLDIPRDGGFDFNKQWMNCSIFTGGRRHGACPKLNEVQPIPGTRMVSNRDIDTMRKEYSVVHPRRWAELVRSRIRGASMLDLITRAAYPRNDFGSSQFPPAHANGILRLGCTIKSVRSANDIRLPRQKAQMPIIKKE